MTEPERAAEFAARVVRMLEHEQFDAREQELIRLSLEYGYLNGASEERWFYIFPRTFPIASR